MPIIALLAIGSALYATFIILIAKVGKGLDPNLNVGIFNTIGGLAPLAIFLFARFAKKAESAPITTSGVLYSVMAGVAIAAFNILLLSIFSRGGVAYAMPVIYGGTIVLSTIAGWVLLGETFSLLQLAGVLVISCGVGMVVASKV